MNLSKFFHINKAIPIPVKYLERLPVEYFRQIVPLGLVHIHKLRNHGYGGGVSLNDYSIT